MKQKLKPLQDNVIVRPLEEEQKTQSGIIIPDTASKEKPMKGEVVAIGPGKIDKDGKRSPMDMNVGDTVIFSRYAPTEIKIDGEDMYVMGSDSVLAIIE